MVLYVKGVDRVKKAVTYSLEDELIERLREASKRTMIPQSRIVEQAIIEYLDKMETTEK